MLDCDQFQSESDQRRDIRSQDSRTRMLFRIVWQFNSCRHQDRLGKQQVTSLRGMSACPRREGATRGKSY